MQTRQNSLFRPLAERKPVEITNVHVHCTHFNSVQTSQNSLFRPSAGQKPVDISKCTNLFLFSFIYPGLLCLLRLGLQSDSGALLPLLPLAPEPPWASLGPWDLPGASGSLGSLWKPLAVLGLQSDSGALLPLLPSPLLLPLTPRASLGSWDLSGASGSFGSLCKPWVFSQTQGPCFPCSPHSLLLPLTPPCSLGPWNLPGASGSLGSLQKPLATLAVFAPKFFGLWWRPTKAFCSYVNGHWVWTVLPGGGDT